GCTPAWGASPPDLPGTNGGGHEVLFHRQHRQKRAWRLPRKRAVNPYPLNTDRLRWGSSMQRHYSIGLLLSALGGLLGALLVALAASNTYGGWHNFRATQQAGEVNAAADSLLVTIDRLTLERGLTNTALTNATPVCSAAAGAIETRRRDVRDAMSAAWPIRSRLAYLAEDVRKAEAAVRAVDDLRQKADQMIVRPRSERDDGVRAQWYPTLTRGVEALT